MHPDNIYRHVLVSACSCKYKILTEFLILNEDDNCSALRWFSLYLTIANVRSDTDPLVSTRRITHRQTVRYRLTLPGALVKPLAQLAFQYGLGCAGGEGVSRFTLDKTGSNSPGAFKNGFTRRNRIPAAYTNLL